MRLSCAWSGKELAQVACGRNAAPFPPSSCSPVCIHWRECDRPALTVASNGHSALKGLWWGELSGHVDPIRSPNRCLAEQRSISTPILPYKYTHRRPHPGFSSSHFEMEARAVVPSAPKLCSPCTSSDKRPIRASKMDRPHRLEHVIDQKGSHGVVNAGKNDDRRLVHSYTGRHTPPSLEEMISRFERGTISGQSTQVLPHRPPH